MGSAIKDLWLFSQSTESFGGTNQVVAKIAQILSGEGIAFQRAIVLGFSQRHDEQGENLYCRAFPLPIYVNNLLAGRKWNNNFKKESVGLIASGTPVPGAIALALNIPYVICMATTLFAEYKVRNGFEEFIQRNYSLAFNRMCLGLNKMIERRVLEKARFIIALSPYLVASLKEDYGIEGNRVAYLPYPIRPATRSKKEGFNKNGPRLLAIGRVNDNRKNYPLLFQSLALFIKKYPETSLRIVGSFSSGSMPLQACERLGLKPYVDFLGSISDEELEKEFKNADIFVLTPRQEGLGIVYLEAMAHGVPVVTTDCGGPRGIITNDINGYLVNQGDPAAFCDFLEKVWPAEERYQRFSDEAYQYIEKNHSPERFNEKFLSILRDRLS